MRNASIPQSTLDTLVEAAADLDDASTLTYLLSLSECILESAVRRAIHAGSIPALSAFAAANPSILNTPLDMRGTPLAVAAMAGKPVPVLAFLLSAGEDPNAPSDPLPSPLALAAALYDTLEAVDELLRHGARLPGSAALHTAASKGNPGMVRALLVRGARPATDASEGAPIPVLALHAAAKAGNEEKIVSMLLENGADAEAVNEAGKTARDIADDNQHAAVSRLLRNGPVRH